MTLPAVGLATLVTLALCVTVTAPLLLLVLLLRDWKRGTLW